MAVREGKDAAPAQAYAELVAAGEPVTVRALKERARVGTDAAAAWLKVNRPPLEVPPVPEDFARTLWPLAVGAARDVAMEDVARELAEAREAEVTALAYAEQAQEAQAAAEEAAARAVEAQRAAETEAKRAWSEVEFGHQRTDQVEAQVRELLSERDRLAVQMRDMEARAVRAETVADTMREVLETLRAEVRDAVKDSKK